MIKQVTIAGGTHGNELTGIYLLQQFEADPECLQYFNFEVTTLLANAKAKAVNRRYIDRDLNRQFSLDQLQQPQDYYEAQRAQEINQLLG